MKTLPATWATDEPCPSGCDAELVLVDNGGPVLRAECRICGHAEAWETLYRPRAGAR
jgi:hypothetical protein